MEVLAKGNITDVTPVGDNPEASLITITSETPEQIKDHIAQGHRLYHFRTKVGVEDMNFESILQWNISIRKFVYLIHSII